MKLRHLFVFSFLLMVFAVTTKGQGCLPQVNLTSYETIAIDSNITTLTVTSEVTGTVIMQGDFCGLGITHTPSVEAGVYDATTGVATNDFYVAGGPVCASCYISESAQTTVSLNYNDTYRVDQGEQVRCSKDGVFYAKSHHTNTHAAITYSQNTHTPAPPNGVYIVDWCTPPSTPPDYQPNVVQSSNPNVLASGYFNGLSVCQRPWDAPAGTNWTCLPNPSPVVTPSGDTTLHTCTNWDKGTKGVYP